MGSSNVAAAVLHVMPRLGTHHRTRVALAVMANIALDEDRPGQPRREYFGGWRVIARALALEGSVESQRQAVSRALRPAKEIGAIEVIHRVRNERQVTSYRLHLEPETLAPHTHTPLAPEAQGLVAPDTQRPLSHTATTVVPHTHTEEKEEPRGTREEPRSTRNSTTERARTRDATTAARRLDHTRRRADAENARQARLEDDGSIGDEPYRPAETMERPA